MSINTITKKPLISAKKAGFSERPIQIADELILRKQHYWCKDLKFNRKNESLTVKSSIAKNKVYLSYIDSISKEIT